MFSWPYSHLLLNHFPVVLSVVGLVTSMLALLVHRRTIWQTAMAALTVAGVFVYPVHFTGDEAQKALEHTWYIKPGVMDAHDQAAGIAMWIILVAGAFAAYSWWRSLKNPQEILPGWTRAGVLVGALAAVISVTYTAYLGGKIIHEAPILNAPSAPAGFVAPNASSTAEN